MKAFALLSLAIAASIALAVPAPLPDSDKIEPVVNSLPTDANKDVAPPLGKEGSGPTTPGKDILVNEIVDKINGSPAKLKRVDHPKKRYASLPLPSGWFYAYKNLNAATEHSSYQTYKSLPASTPNFAQACADFCDSVVGCTFFNVYTEKFGPNTGDQVIKCSLYSLPSTAAQATNDGQLRDGYVVTISGSYGYSKILNPAVDGYTTEQLDGAINGKRANPTDADPYLGYASIDATDPDLCAAACEEKTAYDSRHPSGGSYKACNFFNFYILNKNSVAYKTICSFYLIPFDNSFAVNHGYTSGADTYTIGDSWGFTRNTQQGTGGIVTVA